jgi:Repeat of Unknown Function (DUF347)
MLFWHDRAEPFEMSLLETLSSTMNLTDITDKNALDDIEATAHDNDIPSAFVDVDVVKGKPTEDGASLTEDVILKIPALTIIYWCEKMTATTFGETFADFFTQTRSFGYTYTSIVLVGVFLIFLVLQNQSEILLAAALLVCDGLIKCCRYVFLRLY